MTLNIFTLFPDYFSSILDSSMLQVAQKKSLIKYDVVDLRAFAHDRHRTTDDTPYGGGAGMVMKIEPIDLALKEYGYCKGSEGEKILVTSAKGNLFTQQRAKEFSELNRVALICGHYEGIDQRVIDFIADEELSIGNFILTGGEPAAAVVIDAITRLIPGVLGNEESLEGESHSSEGYLSAPVYTKPAEYKGLKVPEILLSGHHRKIEDWRVKIKKEIYDRN